MVGGGRDRPADDGVPVLWEARFLTGLQALLPPRERLALPGAFESLIWTGGDSTLDKIGCVDWEARVYGLADMEDIALPLQNYAGEEGTGQVIIALGELFCLILLAISRGPCWTNRLVLYVTDNENARTWLTKRSRSTPCRLHCGCGCAALL